MSVCGCSKQTTHSNFYKKFCIDQLHNEVDLTMRNTMTKPVLSAIFVDYDSIYLSLKLKNEESACRFANQSKRWVEAIVSGALITTKNSFLKNTDRRIVMFRCYGNPVPMRSASDNSTDMNSFAFVRQHFLHSGFEIIDCPPLTAQLKNSSDIRMVMDIRDFLDHKTEFDEFIILSSDADFTPLLHRLRAHAKRTIVFTNDDTIAPYTALSDGEVKESELIKVLLDEKLSLVESTSLPQDTGSKQLQDQIISVVVQMVLEADRPVPLETLAERVVSLVGYELTVGTNWLGAKSFYKLLNSLIPESVNLSEQPPYLVSNAQVVTRQQVGQSLDVPLYLSSGEQKSKTGDSINSGELLCSEVQSPHSLPEVAAQETELKFASFPSAYRKGEQHSTDRQAPPQLVGADPEDTMLSAGISDSIPTGQDNMISRDESDPTTSELHEIITRIHNACQAPPFSPPEYRSILAILEHEISENQLQGVKTLENVARSAASIGIKVSVEDARYILDAVTEGGPWLDKGNTAILLAKRLRSHVVRRCKEHGLNLSSGELELIDVWFAAASNPDYKLSEMKTQGSAKETVQTAHFTPLLDDPLNPKVNHNQVDEGMRDNDGRGCDSNPTVSSTVHRVSSFVNSEDNFSQPSNYQRSETSTGDLDEYPRILRNRFRS